MKKKKILKGILLTLLIGLAGIGVYATGSYLYDSADVKFDNTSTSIEVNGSTPSEISVQDAIDALYTKAETAASRSCENGYVKQNATSNGYECNRPPIVADVVKAATGNTKIADAYRYTGASVNNYVYFNCDNMSNQTASTCEVWRILGAYDDGIKIIRNARLSSDMAYDSNNSNVWSTSSLKSFLNNENANTGGYIGGLKQTARNMITTGTWLAGEADYTDTAAQAYAKAQETEVLAKVGLIATYEYLYAAASTCHTVAGNTFNSATSNLSCASQDWLRTTSFTSSNALTLSPYASNSNLILLANSEGKVNVGGANYGYYVFPVVYLYHSTTIIGGDGTSGNPYQLG